MDVLDEFSTKVREYKLPSGSITIENVRELMSLLRWAYYLSEEPITRRSMRSIILELIGKAEAFLWIFVRSYVSLVVRYFNSSPEINAFRNAIDRYEPYVEGAAVIARDVRMLCALMSENPGSNFETASHVLSLIRYAISEAGDMESLRNLLYFALSDTPFSLNIPLREAIPDMEVERESPSLSRYLLIFFRPAWRVFSLLSRLLRRFI